MKLKKKHNRLILLILSICIFSLGAYLVLSNLKSNIVFFIEPTEIVNNESALLNKEIKVGGIVVPDSYKVISSKQAVTFKISDCKNSIKVIYSGFLPKLFRDGQGIIAYGTLKNKQLYANKLLTKHDEYYKPEGLSETEIKFCNKIIKYKK